MRNQSGRWETWAVTMDGKISGYRPEYSVNFKRNDGYSNYLQRFGYATSMDHYHYITEVDRLPLLLKQINKEIQEIKLENDVIYVPVDTKFPVPNREEKAIRIENGVETIRIEKGKLIEMAEKIAFIIATAQSTGESIAVLGDYDNS